MIIRLTVLICVFLSIASRSNAQWQTIYQDSAHFQFNSVYFLNNDTGFVGGYDFTSGSNNGIIFRTKDGGLTWDTTKLGELILCVHFIDSTFGFCGGDGGADYLTTDMGETWQQRGFSSSQSDHSSIFFINPTIGYRSIMQGWIQKTIDTGLTWQTIFNTTGGSYFPGTSKMLFTDNLTGYIAQSRFGQSPSMIGSISKTTDGGNSWIDLSIPPNFFPYSCFFFDSFNGFAVGRYGKVSSTNDGGTSWSTPFAISSYFLYDVAFVTDSIGYIVGGFNQYDTSSIRKGIIFKTIDRGSSWQVMDSSYFDGLTKLHFVSDSIGYAVGMNGIIQKISNANSLLSSIDNIAETNSDLMVYPNPADDHIYIHGYVNEVTTISDLLGNIVLEFTKNQSSDGKLKLNVSSLSSGFYIIRNGVTSAKVIIE